MLCKQGHETLLAALRRLGLAQQPQQQRRQQVSESELQAPVSCSLNLQCCRSAGNASSPWTWKAWLTGSRQVLCSPDAHSRPAAHQNQACPGLQHSSRSLWQC